MFIVTDAHVSELNGNVQAFFSMLEGLAETGEDVIFLGDIFDLWIGLRRYEEPMHLRFLAWCEAYSQRATVGFVEGNHEFYVVRRHRDAFSWSSRKGHDAHGVRFVHGDLVNRADKKYLGFRAITKSLLVRQLIAWMPWGKRFVAVLKEKLKTTNQAFRMGLPEQAMAEAAKKAREEGIRFVLMGHFHKAFHYTTAESAVLWVLPAWLDHGQLNYFDPLQGQLESGPWVEILASYNAKLA